ncbi:uncharacterized protein RAG0_14049 [Rhynchosporium agropyri]|uniref:Uncharacterized protein n=1 Tax=Rhynchosporium agropyri TaxID=914238 RepID=A0A1E1LFA6_9HELO|nr:uncharacterized protein RAG0_14049 [Rhynchosporium agropyri]
MSNDCPAASFKFTSSRATPKDVRNLSQSDDQLRSPNRATSGRSEGEDRGYDSYRPGQSPSRAMFPAPVRSNSAQRPSPPNDSRRPTLVRLPSDPSPRYLPKLLANTSTKSNAEATRNPEVGIRILGMAAQADKERKQREEDAKKYNAQHAQRNSEIMGNGKENTPEEASTGLGWKDKAEATENFNPDTVSASASNDGPTVTVQLAKAIRTIIDEVSEVATLKIRKNTTRDKLDKAQSDLDRSKSHHAGFPSIKETLSQAKKAADQNYKKADEQLKIKDASLDELASWVAEQIIPSVIEGSLSTQQKEKEQKAEARMAALEARCQSYHDIFMDQKTFWDEHKKAKEKSDQEHKAIVEELRLLKAEVETEKPKIFKLFARQNEFTQHMNKLATETAADLAANKESATEMLNTVSMKIPADLHQQLGRLKELDALRIKIDAWDTNANSIADLKTSVATLSDSLRSLKGKSEAYSTAAQTTSQEHTRLRNDVTAVGERIEALVTKYSNAELHNQNLTRAETVAHAATKEAADLALITRMALVEQNMQSITSKSTIYETNASNLKTAVDNLHDRMQTNSARLDSLEENISHADTLEAGQKQILINDLIAIKSRLDRLESSPPSALVTSSAARNQQFAASKTENGVLESNLSSNDLYLAISSEVEQLKANLASQQGELEDLVGITGDTIKDIVGSEISQFTPRLDAVEAKSKTMETSLGNIGTSLTHVEDRVKDQDKEIIDAKKSMVGAAAGSAIDIIRSQNLFAPANLDEKFANALNGVNNVLMEHVEGHSLAIGSLQARMDNLSTGDLHAAMVNQLNATYPSLRKSEMTFQVQGLQIVSLNTKLEAVQKMVEEVQARESKHASAPAPSPVPVPAQPKQDDTLVKALSAKLDEIAQTVVKLQENLEQVETSLTAQEEQTTTELTEIKRQTSILSEEFATNIFGLKSNDEEINIKVSSIGEKVKEIDKRVDNMSVKLHRATTPAPTPIGQISKNAFRSESRNPSSSTPQPLVHSRKNSLAGSDTSGNIKGHKKRLHGDSSNSSTKALVDKFLNSPRTTNGVKHSERSASLCSPNPNPNPAKRVKTSGSRRKFGENEDSEDPDDDDAETNAGISADEDE